MATPSSMGSPLLPSSQPAQPLLQREWSQQVRRSLSVSMGLPMDSLHFAILLMASLIGVIQYGMVTVFGLVVDDLEAYYRLPPGSGNELYDTVQLGSCILSFLPGLCYDHFGAIKTIMLGTILGAVPIFAELDWSRMFPFLDTMLGLRISFFLFGLSATVFQVIAALSPLEAFPKEHLGKVSAIVQLSTSLGITIQSAVYGFFKATFSQFVMAYYTYMLLATLGTGLFMIWVFWEDSELLHRRKEKPQQHFAASKDGSIGPEGHVSTSFLKTAMSANFIYMSFASFGSAAFIYTYRNASGHINSAVGIPASRGMFDWGIYGAVGRVSSNLLLDKTQAHRWGGPLIYVAVSCFIFAAGLLCVALPPAPGRPAVNALNLLAGVANGAYFGIQAPALRLLFGSGSLGLIYGLMYVWTAFGMPLWSAEIPDSEVCKDVTCYRSYCQYGAYAFTLTAVLGLVVMLRLKK